MTALGVLACRDDVTLAVGIPALGTSDLPPKPSFDMLANWVKELLSRLSVGHRFFYAGTNVRLVQR